MVLNTKKLLCKRQNSKMSNGSPLSSLFPLYLASPFFFFGLVLSLIIFKLTSVHVNGKADSKVYIVDLKCHQPYVSTVKRPFMPN